MKYKFDFNLRGGIVIISEWFEELTSLRQLDSRKINDILFTRLKEKRTSFDFRMKIEGNFYQIVSILINIGSESSTYATRYSSNRLTTMYRILVESNGTNGTIVHYAKRWKRWRFHKRMERRRGGDTCGLEVGIARFRSETETGIGGMPLE